MAWTKYNNISSRIYNLVKSSRTVRQNWLSCNLHKQESKNKITSSCSDEFVHLCYLCSGSIKCKHQI